MYVKYDFHILLICKNKRDFCILTFNSMILEFDYNISRSGLLECILINICYAS